MALEWQWTQMGPFMVPVLVNTGVEGSIEAQSRNYIHKPYVTNIGHTNLRAHEVWNRNELRVDFTDLSDKNKTGTRRYKCQNRRIVVRFSEGIYNSATKNIDIVETLHVFTRGATINMSVGPRSGGKYVLWKSMKPSTANL